jgi:hypothetical protein
MVTAATGREDIGPRCSPLQGRIHQPIGTVDHDIAAAWLGPIVDCGFLRSGYFDASGERVLMVLSAPDREGVDMRLNDLPIERKGAVSFSLSHVTALRFS